MPSEIPGVILFAKPMQWCVINGLKNANSCNAQVKSSC